MSSSPSTSSTSSLPTQNPNFCFPIPLRTITPKSQPLLEYQRRTLRTHSYTTHPSKTFTKRRSHSVDRRKMIWSGIFQVQIICAMLLGVFIGLVVLGKWGWRGLNENSKRHFESPGQYKFSVASHYGEIGPENLLLSITREKRLDAPQLRSIEFAVICFMLFVTVSVVRLVCYFRAKRDLCVGCDWADIIEEHIEEEQVEES